MKEFLRLRPGTDNKAFLECKKLAFEVALEVIAPCKYNGRTHIATMIGQYTFKQHNRMTEICAGIRKTPETQEEIRRFSIEVASAGLLFGALVKLVEDPNTQWDDATVFYYQLRNHLENLQACSDAALVVRPVGGS